MTAAPARRRWPAWGLSLCAAAVLAGCAGGSARPKPAELPPNAALIGVRQAWTARLPAVGVSRQNHVGAAMCKHGKPLGTVAQHQIACLRTCQRPKHRRLRLFAQPDDAHLSHIDGCVQ